MTLCVVLRRYRTGFGDPLQADSIVAASISKIGIPSCIGYTRWHSPHFKLGGFSLKTSAFLQAGQTRMSSRSCGIMTNHSTPDAAPKPHAHLRSEERRVGKEC